MVTRIVDIRASFIGLVAFVLAIAALAAADPLARVVGDRIALASPLVYDTHTGALDPADTPLLAAIAALLRSHPTMALEIGAHTDSRGSDAYNLTISQTAADQVRMALITRGVAASRLTAIGYGETRPISTNSTEAGRAANQRVELVVVHP